METHVASEATTIASGGGLADRYAAALYAHADEDHALDTVVSRDGRSWPLIDTSADFRRLIESPLIDVKPAHQSRARGAGSRRLRQAGARFRRRHSANRRLRALRDIVSVLLAGRRSPRHHHRACASAQPLNDLQRQQLRARLIEAGYGNVNIRSRSSPTCSAAWSSGSAPASTIPVLNPGCNACSTP